MQLEEAAKTKFTFEFCLIAAGKDREQHNIKKTLDTLESAENLDGFAKISKTKFKHY